MDIAQTVLDALSERYGSRGLTGWHYLIGTVVSIAGALSAKELYDRRSRFRRKSLGALIGGERLAASVVTQTDRGNEKTEAELSHSESQFILELIQTKASDSPRSNRLMFGSWDEVARYLEANTILRISDFKAPANSTINADAAHSRRAG